MTDSDQQPKKLQDSSLNAEQWQRIDAIFQEVVELAPALRDKRLDELTGDDQHLRVEVESLLAFDREDQSQLPALRLRGDVPITTRQPGTYVGQYQLLFPVAINRTSEVWCAAPNKAAPIKSSGTRVAIKFLREEAHTSRRLERFRKEAMLLARFRHPNIAELLDVGSDDRNVPFIVMRYVAGTPITEFADHKTLSIEERIQLMIRVCDAVSYAHRFLIVHRDLKPSNILVATPHEPVILDFGISKTLDGDVDCDQEVGPTTEQSLTTTNERPMTPAYATPEQVHGEPITTATDVYALGLILYELLSGHHPYSDEAQPTEAKLFDRVCGSMPRRPSEVTAFTARGVQGEKEVPQEPAMIAALRKLSPKQLRKRLRGSLDAVVLRAISKSPTDRYEAIADFRNDLHNILDRQPIAAKLRDDRLRNYVRRNPLGYVFTAATMSALLAGGLGWYFVSRTNTRADQNQNKANKQLKIAQQIAEDAEQERKLLSREFSATEKQMRSSVVGIPNPSPQQTDLNLKQRSTLAFLARQNAEGGKFLRASKYLGEFRDRPYDVEKDGQLSNTTCLDFAYAHQQLGNPTKALSFLASRSHDDFSEHGAKDFIELKLRLLLDAERVADAEELVDGVPHSMFETNAGLLTLARYRSKIQWNEGALELIGQLNELRDRFELTSDQLLELALLEIETSNKLNDLQVVLNSTSQRAVALAIRGRALLRLANAIDTSKTNEKAQAYERVLTNFAALPNHWAAFAAMESLSALYEDEEKLTEARTWRERLWERLLATQEFGTNRAAWCLISMMRNNSAVEHRERVLKLLCRSEVNRNNPYIYRQILTYDFAMGIHHKDWTRAIKSLNLVCPIEKRLWGDDSLDYAFVLASKGFVQRQRDNTPQTESPAEATAKNIVRAKITTIKDMPAKAFLEASLHAVNNNQGNSTSQWIDLFMMHRLNPHDEQLGMVRHIFEQSSNRDSKPMSMLQAVLE